MLLQRISALRPDLPVASRKLAEAILAKPFESAAAPIDALAQTAGVSTATANRFARQLGYMRYSDFRQALFEDVRRTLRPEDKLRSRRGGSTGIELGLSEFSNAATTVRQAYEAIDAQMFADVVKLMGVARRVYVVGFGKSNSIARLAAHLLEPIIANLRECSSVGGAEDAARRMHAIGSGDVLIAITLPRYSRDTISLAKIAVERGAHVVGITDSLLSPLVPASTHPIILPSEHGCQVTSSLPGIAFVEALTIALAVDEPAVEANLSTLTQITDGYITE